MKLNKKKKSANIAGLQPADLLAHSAFYAVLVDIGIIEAQESEYGRLIAKILNASIIAIPLLVGSRNMEKSRYLK